MSTRSATNKRTQNREYAGASRKSAASAKPVRSAASSVHVVPATAKERRRKQERGESLEGLSREEKRARKRELRSREDRIYNVASIMMKEDEDYKKFRRVFWFFMGLGVIAIVVLWIMLLQTSSKEAATVQQVTTVVVAYILIIGAFLFDFLRIRPIRNYYRSKAEGMTDRKIIEFLNSYAEKQDAKEHRKNAKASKDDEKAAPTASAVEPPAKKRPKKNHRSRR